MFVETKLLIYKEFSVNLNSSVDIIMHLVFVLLLFSSTNMTSMIIHEMTITHIIAIHVLPISQFTIPNAQSIYKHHFKLNSTQLQFYDRQNFATVNYVEISIYNQSEST